MRSIAKLRDIFFLRLTERPMVRRIVLNALLASVCSVASFDNSAAQTTNRAHNDIVVNDVSMLNASMRDLVDTGQRAGVVWAVAQNGNVLTLNAHGMRDLEAGLPMENDTVFRLYSQTRPVTAVAVLILVDEGKLSLNDPVAKYLPKIGNMPVIKHIRNGNITATEPQRATMTIRHLLSYTSGLGYARDWPASLGVDQREMLSLDGDLAAMMDRLSKLPLLAHPGARWIYGYHSEVLARIVEIVSAQPYNQFLRERIFLPLGMKDTGFWVQRGSADRLAKVYEPGRKESGAPLAARDAIASSTYTKPGPFFSGGGGLVSTVPDYMRFAQMLANGGILDGVRILNTDTVEAMGTDQLHTAASPVVNGGYAYNPPSALAGYGWGLSIGVRLEGQVHTVPGTPGDMTWGGLANTVFFVDRTHKIAAVAMTQYIGPGADTLAFRLREGVYLKQGE